MVNNPAKILGNRLLLFINKDFEEGLFDQKIKNTPIIIIEVLWFQSDFSNALLSVFKNGTSGIVFELLR